MYRDDWGSNDGELLAASTYSYQVEFENSEIMLND